MRRLSRSVVATVTLVTVLAGSLATSAAAGPPAALTGRLAFAAPGARSTEIVVLDLATGERRQLTRDRAADYFPRWSPDGTRIVFVSNRDGDDELYVIDADGRNLRQLTRNRAPDTTPAWSPDGSAIAFASGRDGGEPELYLMGADGSSPRRLTRTRRFVVDIGPTFTPDGTSLVFASTRIDAGNAELFSLALAGGELRRLTRTVGSDTRLGDDNLPHVSPDGSRVVFYSNRDRNEELYAISPDGSASTRLTRTARRFEIAPRWSPDGTSIVAESRRAGQAVGQLVVSDAAGRGARVVAIGSTPDWTR